MGKASEIWIFDIDGVITNPSTKKIDNDGLVQIIEQKLLSLSPVFFNTGRSAQWVQQTLISRFLASTPLLNLYAVCEMGNTTIEFDQSNQPLVKILHKNLIPLPLSNTIREIVQNSYDQSMFVDNTKKSILTIEMRDGFNQEEYENLQSQLSAEINIILKNYHPDIHVRPSSSTIAIDVKPMDSNKSSGAHLIHDWLNNHKYNLNNSEIIAFGDSPSDLEMASYFATNNLKVKFVYVGDTPLPTSNKFTIITTKEKFSAGTLEYLTS